MSNEFQGDYKDVQPTPDSVLTSSTGPIVAYEDVVKASPAGDDDAVEGAEESREEQEEQVKEDTGDKNAKTTTTAGNKRASDKPADDTKK